MNVIIFRKLAPVIFEKLNHDAKYISKLALET